MKRFSIILVVCIAGCGGQSTTPTAPETRGTGTNRGGDETTVLSDTTVGGIVLQPKTVINGKLSLLISQRFSVMDDQALQLKYPSERRPTLVYANESGSINIAINHSRDRMPQTELGAFHKQMDGMFRKLYPSATWFNSGVIDVNGRQWINLDLRTPAAETEIRNIIVATSLAGRLLLVSFNVTRELEDAWLAPADAIVQSLHVMD